MKTNSIIKGMAVGAGITTAIVGAYMLYGSKNAAKNRKQVKAWMFYAKGEIMEKLENLSEVNEEIYKKIADEVSDKYQAVKNIDKNDVIEFIDELKGHWKNMSKEIGAYNKKSKKSKK